MFLVFLCAWAFGQVQPDPRVLVKQAGATTGQVLKWDGAKWIPDTDIGADGNGIYSGSGTSPANTVVTQAGELSIKNVNSYDFKIGDVDNAVLGDGFSVTPTGVTMGNIFGDSDTYIFSGKGLFGNYLRTNASNLVQGGTNTIWTILGGDFKFADSRGTQLGLEYSGNYSSAILGNARSIPDIGTVKSIYTAGTGISLTPSGNNVVIANTSTDNNGIYTGSGTVPNNTTATLTDDFTFSGVDNTGTQSPKFRVTATGTDPGVQVWKVGNDSLQLSFLSGEPILEYAGQSGNDFWIKTGVHDLRIDGSSFQTYPTKNIFGGYVATPYVQVAANTTINENIQNVDVLGATGSVTLTFDNTTNLLGTYSKTVTVRNRGAHNVVLSRGSQSWEWSDFTGANTASNQTLLPGETGIMFWEDAGVTDYYVLQKIPSTFASGSGDILNGGNTGAVVIGTNDNNTLSFETNGVTRATISTGSSDGGKLTISNVSANTSTPEDAITVQSNSNGTASTGFGPALFLQGESSTTNNRNMARIGAVWTTATDASREAKLSFQLGNNASTLAEVANINVSGNDLGQLSVGSSTPVTIQPTGLTTSTNFTVGNSANTLTLGGAVGTVVMSSSVNGYAIDINASGNTGFVAVGGTTASTITAGTKTNMDFPQGFTASSGTSTFNNILLSGTINQSGTATGEVHGLHVNHTITSALKYRGVQLDVDGTNVSGIYQTGANATNNFVGKTFFGATTAPTAMLHLGAGTTTLAPLKLTSGTNLTTPQAGAIEWDGTSLFVTQTTGPTRKTIAYTSDITGGEVIISPASLSTDQNNWNPTDLATATIIRMTSSVNLLMITGITAPSAAKKLTLVNTGSNTFILTAQDANSSAANRLQFKKDVPLFPGGSVTVMYDLTSAVWRLESTAYEHKFVSDREVSMEWSKIYVSDVAGDGIQTTGGTANAPTATTAASLNLTAPSAESYHLLGEYLAGNIQYFYSSNSSRISAYAETTIVTPANLSDATNNYAIAGGFFAAIGASEPQGMSIFYNHSVNGGKWLCYTKGTSSSTVDSGVTFAVSTKYKLAVQARPDNSVVYFIDDVLVGKTTTNMPTQALWAGSHFFKIAGTGRAYSVYNMEARQIR